MLTLKYPGRNLLLWFVGGIALATVATAGDTVYNRYNIHYYPKTGRGGKVDNIASYANYVEADGGKFIPAGSEITVAKRRGIVSGFTITAKDGTEVAFEYNVKNMAGMSAEEYIKLITSDAPVKVDEIQGLNDKDKEGIKTGKVMEGMTKEGVKTALGYPAKHKTPSEEENVWTYWKDRWRTLTVNFEDGKVKTINR